MADKDNIFKQVPLKMDGKFPIITLMQLLDRGVNIAIGRTDHMQDFLDATNIELTEKVPSYVVLISRGERVFFKSLPVSIVMELKTLDCVSDWVYECIREAADTDWDADEDDILEGYTD